MATTTLASVDVLEQGLDMSREVVRRLLGDLTETQWLLRPHAECNPINWQVGHLILSEHQQMQRIAPVAMPKLPEGFSDVYQKPAGRPVDLPTCKSTDALFSQADLLEAMNEQRVATVSTLRKFTPELLQLPSGVDYAPFNYSIFLMIAIHWTMHSGQWAIIRREAGLPIVM